MVGADRSFCVPFVAMASECSIVLGAQNQKQANQLAVPAIAEVARIEARYSRYRDASIISRINAAAGHDWVALDAETASLINYAQALFDSSGGKFDITSGVLRRAWNFRVARVPTQAELAPLLELVGWDRIEHREGQIRLAQARMELDFGGIGKEYAADRAAAILTGQGVRHGYVNLGGDLRVIGPQPDGRAWQIGVQNPRQPDQLAASIAVQAGALATSGDYERYVEVDAQRYCHILDPASGRPVNYWRSITVLAPLAIVAGSHATIGMLLERDGLAFLDQSQLAYLAIDQAGHVYKKQAASAPVRGSGPGEEKSLTLKLAV